MTNKTIKAGSILILIVLFGCNDVEKSNSNIKIRQWQYADGTIMKEMEYLSDSIPHGTYRFYYPSGVLQDSAQLTYNKFHGKRFEYHENGKLYKLTTYFNGKHRTGVDFRADGSLQYYFAFNYHEEPTFMIQYDSLGRIIKHEGFPIFSWIQEKKYTLREEFSVEILVAEPPNCKANVSISDWDIYLQEAKNKKTYYPDEFNRVTYSRKQNPKNNINILHIVALTDTTTRIIFSDTLVITVAKDGKSSYTRELPRKPL